MSKITTIVDSIITKVNEHTTNYGEHIPLSGVTAYHLLQGNLAVSNSTITQGFNTTLYTGNGTMQAVNTDIDMSTQWGNDASETFGGLVWIKSRSTTSFNLFHDTTRGFSKAISSNDTKADATNNVMLNTVNGFSIANNDGAYNQNAATYASWNFQTTHRVSGTTNHGKAYTCHFNPFTGFTIVKYEGSGIAGHEIPHHLGRKLGFVTIKSLNAVNNWAALTGNGSYGLLNLTGALTSGATEVLSEQSVTFNNNNTATNTSTNQYIMYGWANSYFDESNKLIGNYELVTYQGTGAVGNKVKTKGKPAWVMIKRTDAAGYWATYDNKRTPDKYLLVNMPDQESNTQALGTFDSNGFTIKNTVWSDINAAGGQYIALVAYDTNSNGGGSYYPLASDTANVQINNALIPLAQGIDSNGAKNNILSKNETITGLTYTQGKNYVYCDKNGSYGRMSTAPNYGKTNPANGGDFYNVLTNKWFTSAGVEITNSRNYLNHIVYADNDGGVLYVEELPKIEYKDIVKANEFRGKNACTAWANIDMTTTPPTIRDSYNVGLVIRTSAGNGDIYFKELMDNTNYAIFIGNGMNIASNIASNTMHSKELNMFKITHWENGTTYNLPDLYIFVTGGKN